MADRPTRADPEGSVPTLIPEREPEGPVRGTRGDVGAAAGSGWAPAAQVLVVVALGLGLRLYRLGQQPLWLDEASSLRFAHASLAHLWSWNAPVDAGNPPLYYSLLHGWLIFGQGEASLRLLSALLGAATIPLVYAMGRTVRDHRLGVLAALLFAISPFQVWYAQEARGYALLTLGAASAMWGVSYLLRYPERSGSKLPFSRFRIRPAEGWEGAGIRPRPTGAGWAWLAYVLGIVVALLAHDTAVLLLIGANALMLGWWVRRDRLPGFLRNWALAQIAVLCLWGGWLPGFARQLIHGDSYAWIPEPTIHRVVRGTFAIYGGPMRGAPRAVAAIVILALAGLGLWSWRREQRWIAYVLVFSLAGLLGELIATAWRPIFLPRTLIWAGVPVILAVAAGLLALRRPLVFAGALALLVALSAWGLDTYYFHHDREAWDRAAAYVDRGLQHGDAIVFSEDFLRIPFDYYYRAPGSYSVPEIGLTGSSGDPSLVLRATATRRRVWLIVSHARPDTDAVLASLGGTGQLTSVAQFTRVDVYLYDLTT